MVCVRSMEKLSDAHFIVGQEQGLRFKHANATMTTRIMSSKTITLFGNS